MIGGSEAIQRLLNHLLDRDEVLGAVAASSEGLVLGVAGVPGDEAAALAALGASLAGVAQRTTARLCGGKPGLLTISSSDGMIHVRGEEDVALVVLTERCDATPLSLACETAIEALCSLFVAA